MGPVARVRSLCGLFAAACLLVALVGCNDSASSSTATSTAAGGSAASLTITGTPPTAASVGSLYSFQPAVADASGTVGYSIENIPSWASFSTVTGQLQGTPSSANVGVYHDIVIRASNGGQSAALPAFSVTVGNGTAAASDGPGSVTLAWSPPVSDTDGSPLSDLAGFYIYYGTDSSEPVNLINDETGGVDTGGFTVSGLAPGTYYFQVSAYTALGVQSAPSNQVSVTVTS